MSVGTGIESIRRRQEREQAHNAGRPRNAKRILKSSSIFVPLNTTVGGTPYQTFIPSVHNPDDTTTIRYVP